VSSGTQRFRVRFTGANKAMAVLGLTPGNSFVDVCATDVVVRLGWAFRATVPRSTVQAVAPDHDEVRGWGAHGWNGRWLVNGSSSGIVRIELRPAGRARVAGFPVTLSEVRVSVDDPAGLERALAPIGVGAGPAGTAT
jgi:hypothetical protein